MIDDGPKASLRNAGRSTSRSEAARSIELSENRMDSRDLFQSAREIIIAHGDETYRLRLTAQNKLILTK